MTGMSDKSWSHTEDTAAAEGAAYGRQRNTHPGLSYLVLLSNLLPVPPVLNPAGTQLKEELEKGASGVSPTVTQSKAEEGPRMDLRANRPRTAHVSIFKLRLLE